MSHEPKKPRKRQSPLPSADRRTLAAELESLRLQNTQLREALASHQRAQEELSTSEARFRTFADHATDAFFLHDDKGTILEVNRQACESLGYTREELIGLTPFDFDADVDQTFLEQLQARLAAGEMIAFDARHRRKDGTVFPVEVRIRPFQEGGRQFGVSVVRDITERKRVEQNITLMNFALDHVREAAFLIDEKARFHFVNEESCRILGYTHAELLGLSVPDIDPDFPIDRWLNHWSTLKTQRSLLFEGRHKAKDGHIFPIEINANYFEYDGQGYNLALVRDITDRKRTEEALQEERRLFIGGPNVAFKWKATEGWPVEYVSPNIVDQFGYPPEDFTSGRVSYASIVHPDDLTWVAKEVTRYSESKVPFFEQEYRIARSDGKYRWVYDFTVVVRDSDGVITHYSGHINDITERKQAEEERQAHLWLLESLDKVNRAIQETNDLQQVMRDVLDVLLSVFACDRAWLAYPCDPEASLWQVPMERTRPEYPGVLPIGIGLPLDPSGAAVYRILRASAGPVQFGPGSTYPVPIEMAQGFGVQSFIAMAFYPKVDKPWAFGLHQCSYPRSWTPEEERLFQEIGRRLSDALTSLLMYRNLQDSEAKFSTAFRSSPSALSVSLAKDHAYLDVNESFLQWTGYTRTEVVGRTSVELNLWAEPAQDREFRRLLHEHGSVYNFEYAYRRKDGAVRYALISATLITLGGEPCVLAQANDITQHKQVEEALHQSEERIRRITENAKDMIYRMSVPDGKYEYVSPAATEITGYPPDELYANPLLIKKMIHPNWSQYFEEQWNNLLEGNVPSSYEYQILHKLGEVRWINQRNVLIRNRAGTPIAIEGVVTDITERKAAEKRLKDSEERLRLTLEATQIGIWDWDVKNDRWYASPIYYTMLGYEPRPGPADRGEWLERVHPDDQAHVQEKIQDVLSRDFKLYEYEARLRHANGTYRWQGVAGFGIERGSDGKVTRMLGIRMDIDDRKRAEQEAIQLAAIVQSSDDAIIGKTLEGVVTSWNKGAEKIYGYTKREIIGKPISILASTERQTELPAILARIKQGEHIDHYETIRRRKDGRDIHLSLTISPIKDTDGKIIGASTIGRDITEQKQIAENLRATSLYARSLIEASLDPLVTISPDGKITDVNQATELATGVARANLIGDDFSNYFTEPNKARAGYQQVLAQGFVRDYPLTVRHVSGQTQDVLYNASVYTNEAGDLQGVFAAARDITELKRAEEEIARALEAEKQARKVAEILREANESLSRALNLDDVLHNLLQYLNRLVPYDSANVMLLESDVRLRVAALRGYERWTDMDMTRSIVFDLRTAPHLNKLVTTQKSTLIANTYDHPGWIRYTGTEHVVSWLGVPIIAEGQVIGLYSVDKVEPGFFTEEHRRLAEGLAAQAAVAIQNTRLHDQLKRANVELEQRVIDRTAELARAHENLRAILDTAGEGVVFTDPHGVIEYINPAMERLTGYPAAEVIGRNPRLWKSDQTSADTYEQMWSALTRGEIWAGELINRRKDGTLYDAALTAAPLTNSDGHIVGFVGVQRDITHQKELDRLKDQFVSNVSHELRTPLANILLHVELLERGHPDRRDIYLRTLRREAERLRKMIEDLLDLSRLERDVASMQLAPIDLNQLLEQLVADRAALAGQRGLTLTYEPAPDLPFVLTDASKLIQVASNLMTNALNYTPAQGVVRVWAEVRQHEGQKMAVFTVRDTGPGISAQDLSHLFERFYRGAAGRRASAPGTGLGLAISQEIMKRLGGRITVESEVSQGAAFTVWLPSA